MKWLRNYKMPNCKTFLTAFLIFNYPDELLGQIKDRHPIDILLYDNAALLLNQFQHIKRYDDINKLLNYIVMFEDFFCEWKNMDKNRTVQNIIISYHHRREHIKAIKDDTIQNKQIIETLNGECDTMLQTIQIIDPTYDIEYVKQNYNIILDTITTTTRDIENKIKNNFKNAYIDYLVHEFIDNCDLNIIKRLILDTNKRILCCVPQNIKNSIQQKLGQYNYDEMLLDNTWTNIYSDYFKFIFDTITCVDKTLIIPVKELYDVVGNNSQTHLPYILVNINMLLDKITS